MKRVAVFCGSNTGVNSAFVEQTRALAEELATRGLELVYGGGRVGLMGVLADEALRVGVKVTGVIPEVLDRKEVVHRGIDDLKLVASMHERKQLISDLSDAFIALPGGFGTLDEFFEMVTWAQLGLHRKPCGFLNTAGFFDRILEFLDHAMEEKFITFEHRLMISVAADPKALLEKFEDHVAPQGEKWIDVDET